VGATVGRGVDVGVFTPVAVGCGDGVEVGGGKVGVRVGTNAVGIKVGKTLAWTLLQAVKIPREKSRI